MFAALAADRDLRFDGRNRCCFRLDEPGLVEYVVGDDGSRGRGAEVTASGESGGVGFDFRIHSVCRAAVIRACGLRAAAETARVATRWWAGVGKSGPIR
jgi:hypothetical protein